MRRLRWLLGLVLLAGCAAVPRARRAGYRELAAWLEAHALPGESVAVQDRDAWARLTDRPLVALPSGNDAHALLERIHEARPDYCVALRSVAWEGVRAAPWFRERYEEVAGVAAAGDPAAPLALYRYRPSPFDGGAALPLDLTVRGEGVGRLTVEAVRASSHRLLPGEPVYVSATLSGDLREALGAVWQLRDPATGQLWLRELRAEPGGLPTDAWPVSGTVVSRYVVVAPEELPAGDYLLELAFTRPNRAPFGAPVPAVTLARPETVSRTPPAPDHPLKVAAGDAIELVGYDAPERLAPGETLWVALYWHALRPVREDLKVFVHLFGPEGELVAQSDAVPAAWSYPTTAWQPGEYVRDRHAIPLSADLPRGDYRVLAGLYDPASGERLALHDAQGAPWSAGAALLYTLQVR